MKLVKLGNLTSIQTGKIDVNKAVAGGKYPFFTCSRDVYEIDEAPFEGKAVLVAGNGDLNVKYYEGKFNAYQRTYFLFVNDENELVPRYLYWFLESYVGKLRSDSIGSTIKYIKMGNLTEAEIPLLSLDKQRDIVEKLDKVFAETDLLEGNLELSDEKASQLFQSLLSSAFSLTADENKSSNSSRDYFISPKLVPLGTLAEVIAGQSPEGIYYNSNGEGVPFYQGKKEFGDKYLGAPTTWTTKITKLAQSGDILMSVRAPVGPVNFATQEICIGRGLAAIRPSELVDKDFLFYFLLHKQSEISGNAGAVFDSINKDQIASIEIPLISLEKQRQVVDKLDYAFSGIETQREKIMAQRNCVVELRQSLLSRAFHHEEAVA